jgi:hypothetical protein
VKSRCVFAALALAVLLAGLCAPLDAAPRGGEWGEYNRAEGVIVADLAAVRWGPVANSMPPIYTARLSLTVVEALRGSYKKGAAVQAHYSARQRQRPALPQGRYVVALSRARGGTRAMSLRPAAKKRVATAREATAVPVGWDPDAKQPPRMAGKGITMSVEPVPPARKIKWTNPDGDGSYRITVTNTAKEAKPVPALLSAGGRILWADSVSIVCQGKTRRLPTATGKAGQAAVLQPGQSVSGVLNAFLLEGIQWPRGGYRVEFRFCLGELAETESFYYLSRHHDRVRADAVRLLKKGG